MTSREHISFLAGSENRVRVLEALRDRPYRQSELVRECDLSRSTVHRALDGLTARDWVARDDSEFRLTVGGAFVLDRYDALEATVERVDEWGSFLSRLGDVAATLPPAALDDATLVSATPDDPHAAITHLAGSFTASEVEGFCGISPIVSGVVNEAAFELVSAGVPMELIIDDSVFAISEDSYPDALDDAQSFENVALFLSPESLHFGLAILDERVLIGAYDERGVLCECLDGTGDALLAWACETYEDYRTAARCVDPATLG